MYNLELYNQSHSYFCRSSLIFEVTGKQGDSIVTMLEIPMLISDQYIFIIYFHVHVLFREEVR